MVLFEMRERHEHDYLLSENRSLSHVLLCGRERLLHRGNGSRAGRGIALGKKGVDLAHSFHLHGAIVRGQNGNGKVRGSREALQIVV